MLILSDREVNQRERKELACEEEKVVKVYQSKALSELGYQWSTNKRPELKHLIALGSGVLMVTK